MKKTVLSLFTALVLLVSSIVPMGTISVSANNDVAVPEPLASLLENGKIKIADFSNLTEEELEGYIDKKENMEDGDLSINTDSAHTLNGAKTSLKWDIEAGQSESVRIKTNYNLAQFSDYEYNIYVTLKPVPVVAEGVSYNDKESKIQLTLCAKNTSGSTKYATDGANSYSVPNTDVGVWRQGSRSLSLAGSSTSKQLLNGIASVSENSNIMVRLLSLSNSKAACSFYVDSIELRLVNYDKTMSYPTPSIADASEVNAPNFNGYTLAFDKNIVASSDAVTVKKDSEDITSQVTSEVSGSNINLSFLNGVQEDSVYAVTVDNSKVRAVSGEYLEDSVTYTFNVLRSADEIRREIMADVLSDGMIKLADFSNLTPEEISKYIVTVDNEAANDVSVNSDSAYTIDGRATSLKWTLAGNGTSKGFVIKTDYKVSDFAGLDYTIWVSSQAAPLSAQEWAASPAPVYKSYTLLGAESGGEVKFVNATGMTYNSTNSGIWRNAEEFYNNGSSKGIAVKSASASSPELLASCDPDDNANIYVKVHANKSTVTGPLYFDGIWLILNNNRATMANPVPSVADNSAILKNTTNTYTLTFDKNIVVTDDAITVTKDGVVLTPEITVNASVATIKFAENFTAGEYKVTLDSSKLRAVSGEALSADKTYRFTVLEDSNTIVLSADKLSACAVVSAGAYPKATLVAAVYDSKTLENVYTSEITNGYITISIPALAAGQTVKYMLIEDMTTLTPMQSCVEYTAN